MCRLDQRKVLLARGPRHTPVQRGLHFLNLENAGRLLGRSDRHFLKVAAWAFEAYPGETLPSVKLSFEVGPFVNNGARITTPRIA